MLRHSWYLSPELATLALFSKQVPVEEKSELISNMIVEREYHLVQTLPSAVSQLKISRSFFTTSGIDDSFLEIPVCEWRQSECYTSAVNKGPSIKDVHKEGGGWRYSKSGQNVDMGRGYLSSSGRPQT